MQKMPDDVIAKYYLTVFYIKEPNLIIDLLIQFCRLKNYNITQRSTIEVMIDNATGYDNKILTEFAHFIFEYVVLKILPHDLIMWCEEELHDV